MELDEKIVSNEQAIEDHIVDDLDLLAQEDSKEFANRCRAVEALEKIKAARIAAENEAKKLENERLLNEARLENEKRKLDDEKKAEEARIEIEKERLENEKKATEADVKDKKKTFWLNFGKAAIGVTVAAASIYIGRKQWKEAVVYEQEGSWRTAVGKGAFKNMMNALEKGFSKADKALI